MQRIFSALVLCTIVITGTLASSPIHAAVQTNDPTAVRNAVSNGADVDEVDDLGLTPLVAAVLRDHLRAAAALMKLGADVTIPGNDGYTPMHIAAQLGHGKIVKMMLRYDRVNAQEMHSDGLAAFHRACLGDSAGHTDALFAFLEAGVPPDLPTTSGVRPIDIAGSENSRILLMEALQEQRRARK